MEFLPEFPAAWRDVLEGIESDLYEIDQRLSCRDERVLPPANLIFEALNLTPPESVKVLIVGQDPYHGVNQAEGLAFSVSATPPPPSLRNIFTEYSSDLSLPIPRSGSLRKWAERGVLLLNQILTVAESSALSHKDIGWQRVTKRVVDYIGESDNPTSFILWGRGAQDLIDERCVKNHHQIIRSPHPSPLSAYRGFFGSRPFSRVNSFRQENGLSPIKWEL